MRDGEQPEGEQKHPRDELWRAALWAGFANQEKIVEDLKAMRRPWYGELAPLTAEERVFIVFQLCKAWYPQMDADRQKQSFKILWRLFGARKRPVGFEKESSNGPH